MIIEVLSPSTKKKDMFIKLNKYQNAGVREYLMIDLKNERIIVYQFERDDLVTIYGFSDSVPVGIYDGELQINFKEITDYFSWIQNWE
jgi:Uma2 family endonuclease